MRISCQHCGKSFQLPEEKIPQGERFWFKCPACNEKNKVELSDPENNKESESVDSVQEYGFSPDNSEIEPDAFPLDANVAFIYVQNKIWDEEIRKYLIKFGYYIVDAENITEATKKIQVNRYKVIFLEDLPEIYSVLREIAKWSGMFRREVNCILVGNRAQSFDPFQAFLLGVNSYLSINETDKIDGLLNQAEKVFERHIEPWKLE